MSNKQCVQCGELNPMEAIFCMSCGASNFREVPPGLRQRLQSSSALSVGESVHLSAARVLFLAVLSFGLYQLYWFYLTWKQLASETDEDHYPVWHALSLFVPIYNLFRVHRHMSVIKELASRSSVVLHV